MTVIITNSAHQDDDKRYNPDVITVIPLPSDEDDDSVPLVHPVPVAPHDEFPAVLALFRSIRDFILRKMRSITLFDRNHIDWYIL